MDLIGLTGGIASGKSTVSDRLRDVHGWTIVDADQVARDVVEPGQPALREIAEHFGSDVMQTDGSLDRPALGAIVFADEQQRLALNGITHPRIAAEMGRRIRELSESERPVVVDSPLLIEMGHADNYPVIVVVLATPEIQHHRLVEKRGMDPDEAWGRINSQASNDQRRALATHVIDNTGDMEQLRAQIEDLASQVHPDS